MESYQLKGVIQSHARAVKSCCLKIISNKLSLADRDMFLRAIISDMDTITNLVEEELKSSKVFDRDILGARISIKAQETKNEN